MKGGKTVAITNSSGYTEKQHNIVLENRKKLVMSGVLEVESFEDDVVELKTSKGELTIRGENLKMESFISETGDLVVNGNIYAFVYLNDTSKKQGFLNRLFK